MSATIIKNYSDLLPLAKEILTMASIPFDNLIKFEDLMKNWKVGDKKQIYGTSNELIIKTSRHLRFLTTIPAGASFEKHWHDCEEHCTIIGGQLNDPELKRVWKTGETVIYNRFVQHRPCNISKLETCYLIVDFYK